MWVHNPANLVADFDSGGAGPNFTEFKAWAAQRLPGAALAPPKVTVVPRNLAAVPIITDVRIQLFWLAPGDPSAVAHVYDIVATVASN